MNITVTRSPMRMLAYALFAVPAILLAVDMTVSHRLYPRPDSFEQVVASTVDETGETVEITRSVLSADGKAEWRRDRAMAAVLFLGGIAAMGWATLALLAPRPLLRATDDGISVRIDGMRRPPRLLPWESIDEVKSGVLDADGTELPVLSIKLEDPEMVPVDPAGGVADPPWLHIWGEDWDVAPHQLAPLLDPRAQQVPGERHE